MTANAVRLLVSAGAGLAAVYWLNLGVTGLFAAIAAGFCIYAALTTLAVVRVSPPWLMVPISMQIPFERH